MPAAIKDLFDFKPGWPSTFGGIPALRDFTLDTYCAFAERAEQAGAILVGKGNSPVMGFRGVCDNPLFGPSRNPFDTSRNTGGSSGGCAAAVADGLLTFAEGTDGGGSIRIPASWCGIYGLKQSFGRVPFILRPNAFGGTDPFLFEGPLTRTVEDAALVLSAIAGYDPRDPLSLDDPTDFTGAVRRPIKGMRIAYTRDYDVFPIDRRIAAVVDEAVQAFEQAGAHVEEVATRDQARPARAVGPLVPADHADQHRHHRRAEGHGDSTSPTTCPPQYREWLDRAYEFTALDIANDQAMRTEVFDAFQDVFSRYDLIVGPTLSALPVKNGDDGNTVGPTEVEGVAVDPLIGWCPTYLVNYTGHPAASVPAGLADGLPVGMQIIGRSHADADVLAASAAFERLRPWRDTYRIPAERPL